MNRTEFILTTAIILFVAFALGWFANWLVHRFTRVRQSDVADLDRMSQELHEAEETRDQAITEASVDTYSDTFAGKAHRALAGFVA